MGKRSRWLVGLGGLIVIVGGVTWQGWRWWQQAIAPVQPDAATEQTEPVSVVIEPGTSAQAIGQQLTDASLIRSPFAWEMWTRWQTWQGREGGYLAGTYAVSPADSLPEIADQIWQGQTVQESIVIPEGWSIAQMADYLEAEGWFSAEAFVAATRQANWGEEFPWLPPDLPHLEGFLYPETYFLPEAATPDLVVRQMLSQFETIALPEYDEGAATQYTLLEWVTLASIVEKEAVVSEERSLIASVFAKRLNEGISLGADPTVEYGLGIEQTPENPLTFEQVRTPSPYNTYINLGLPPTPIASPGIASLRASLAPEETEYLYFVARYDGTHVFSRTLAEHEAAQIEIRRETDNP